MDKLDLIIATGIAALSAAFIYIIWNYAKGLRGCPRELYLLFFTKVTEYSCYGAINMAMVLFLTADTGLSDIGAGSYIGAWSMFLTVATMFVGSVCDAIGVRKTLLVGTIILLISRLFLPLTTDIYAVSILGFIPMALGIAIMGPVLSVGIKYFTTTETSALGFGMFYTLMNVGWAVGAWIFDYIRGIFGEHSMVPIMGMEFSTYQIIFMTGFIFTLPDLIAVLFMRDGVEMTDDKGVVIHPAKEREEGVGIVSTFTKTIGGAVKETFSIFGKVISEKPFWIFLGLLAIAIPAKLIFYHFHYTWPKYGIRVLGEGAKIGNIFGVLNPVMIIFLTPLFAALTRKFSSFWVLTVGTLVSTTSIFIAVIPQEVFTPLASTWFGELVFVRWLDVPAAAQQPYFLALVIMVAMFTIGEAIWSPRLMQFTAELAPKGKEGTYIALSFLPYFASKLIVGPMSGWLVSTYTPEGLASYPDHQMVWVWIGGTAILTPIGFLIFKKAFQNAVKSAAERSEDLDESKSDDEPSISSDDLEPSPA